jgi:hypothetical protein
VVRSLSRSISVVEADTVVAAWIVHPPGPVAAETIQMLCAHTKVWRLSDPGAVGPLHVSRALQLCGGGGSQLWSGKGTHFGALLERFSEGEGSDDVPLAERARRGKGKAIARSENEDDDVGEGDQELQ